MDAVRTSSFPPEFEILFSCFKSKSGGARGLLIRLIILDSHSNHAVADPWYWLEIKDFQASKKAPSGLIPNGAPCVFFPA